MQSFNVAGQGPFPVTIEDFSSRNDLLPLSNVHPLSVTDLLQREDCCCYISEYLLKMKVRDLHIDSTDTLKHQENSSSAHNRQLWRFWGPFSSSAREPLHFLPELLLVFIHQRLSSSEALCLLSASEFHLREQSSFYCAVFSLFSPSPCILYLYSFGLTSFFLYSSFSLCCSFSGT